jgi:medium-chain acyl-[acyl-carrier-protein] hydrolase
VTAGAGTEHATVWARRHTSLASEPAIRLICLPYAGGSASAFREWRLPDDLRTEVWAVQLPGRENRISEPLVRRLDPLLDGLAEGLRPLLDRPFALFGHSLGALVAFELARLLRRAGRRLPAHLILSAHRAPELPPRREPMSTLPDEDFVARLEEMNGPAPELLHDPAFALLAPMIRADFELAESYTYRADEPLDASVTCLAAADDPDVGVAEVAAWSRHFVRSGRLRVFTGGHLFLHRHTAEVLECISEALRAG